MPVGSCPTHLFSSPLPLQQPPTSKWEGAVYYPVVRDKSLGLIAGTRAVSNTPTPTPRSPGPLHDPQGKVLDGKEGKQRNT